MEPSDSHRIEHFVDAVTDYAIYVLSPAGFVKSWNVGAQRFKRYSADEILGQHFSCFYTDEDQAAGLPERALQTAREQGKFEGEGWRVRKDGSRFWASVVINAVRDEDGELIGFAKVTRDITERRNTQEALYASEEKFRLLVQGVTDYAIYMLSPDGIITNWNAGASRIKGYAESEVVGTHFSRFYTEADRLEGLPARALATAAAEGRVESEGWRVRKDGSRFWSHVVIDAIHNEAGKLIGFAKITRDITERRDAAMALERARELLFQSQKLEAIGKLTGGIAHDFNNLLGVIVSGAELLSRELKTPSAEKILATMQRAATRGATLTQQLLSFARQQPLTQQNYNLNRVIERFESILRRAAGDPVTFELTLDPALGLVRIDAAQFEASLLNLVSNARDAMPDGGTITITTENLQLAPNEVAGLAAGGYVRASVRDTGSGMTPEVLNRALEPFFTTKPVGKGTGLGLSQAYGLVQQSSGQIVLDSVSGNGTTIALYFPMLLATEREEGASFDTSAGNDMALVVDDQPDVLEVAVELFKTIGYDVLTANSGVEGLAILRRVPGIDVLFSDVVMPGMNGVQLGLEALKINPGITVLLASGYAEPELANQMSELTQFQVLKKPYRLADIVRKLRHKA